MKKDLLTRLESLLDQYDNVLLVDLWDPEMKARWERFWSAGHFVRRKKRIVFLSTAESSIAENFGYSYLKITEKTFHELKELYFMYEFSDRFQFISDEENFGVIWNYVDTGILTEQEAFQALLWGRE